jgi:outer membrane lipoprotein-sorting protein
MKKYLLPALMAVITGLPAAAATWTPDQLIDGWVQHQQVGFTGNRVQDLARGDMKLHLTGKVIYRDPGNFQISITNPPGMKAMQLALQSHKSQFFFPEERLHFDNDNPAAREYAESILSHLTDRPDLLRKNYSLLVMGDDITALTPTVILDAAPTNGYRTPGRRFWLSKERFQILREERRWASNMEPYFTSYYTDFDFAPAAALKLPDSTGWRRMILRQGTVNSFRWYPTMGELNQATGANLPMPSYTPPGFELADVSTGAFYGTQINVMRYTDGLNNLWVMVRPSTNIFVGLIAGQFALSLMKRFQDIVYNLPYNYQMHETNGTWVYAYGDLYPEDLKAVAQSVPVPPPPTAAPAAGQQTKR